MQYCLVFAADTSYCLYGKCPKISKTLLNTFLLSLLFVQLFLKNVSEMSNSVQPDQTAPSGTV